MASRSMIGADAFQIQHRVTGLFLQVDGWGPDNAFAYYWKSEQTEAGTWRGSEVDRFLMDRPEQFANEPLRKVPGPACGCCGARYWSANRYDATRPKMVVESANPLRRVWRCEKHIGRNPCCIEGCKRTFAHKDDGDGRGAESYHWTVMCGHCWRQAPKWMRDRVTKIRRLARRRGWTEQISRLHSMAWGACHRAIVNGRRLDEAEINKMFGWDQ